MFLLRPVAIFTLSVLFASASSGQQLGSQPTQVVQRDPQALTVLTQVLNAGGGVQALTAVHDFTATGKVTYYWGGEEVQGSATIKGRSTGQFRVDAALSSGSLKFIVSNGTGSFTGPNGDSQPVEYHNAVNFGSLTFPLSYLAAAPQDASTSITYVGLETLDGAQLHHIRMQKVPAVQNNLTNVISHLSIRDFYIDPSTFQVVSSLDMVHPKDASGIDIPHKVQFSNYQQINGIFVPFSIVEYVSGQRTSSTQLSQITFNVNLADSDFQP